MGYVLSGSAGERVASETLCYLNSLPLLLRAIEDTLWVSFHRLLT